MKILKLGQMLGGSNKPILYNNLYSLDFDGVDDFVNLGNNSSLRPTVNDGVSLSLWCKWADITTATSRIFSNSSESSAYYGLSCNKNASGYLSMSTGDGGGFAVSDRRTLKTDAAAVSNNTWHHIVFVWSNEMSSTWKMYVDGETPASSVSGTGGFNAYTTDDAFIGKQILASTSYANGLMDEVAFFDAALASDQVIKIYNSGTPYDLSGENNLIGYWRNGDPNGTSSYPTITDDSSNSNNGTMTNMASGDIVTDAP
jgi:hypothetical protein